MLRPSKGNMYDFINYTWNPIKGRCNYRCIYCNLRHIIQKEIRLFEKELHQDLGEDNLIFVGSSTDMFSEQVADEWIIRVLEHCRKFNNTYLFQTKNPKRFIQLLDCFPINTIFGTTLESDELNPEISNAPSIQERVDAMRKLDVERKMVTIEPIFSFNHSRMIRNIKDIRPEWINIGADSNKSKEYEIEEPSQEEIVALINDLRKMTKVKIKSNLTRVLNNVAEKEKNMDDGHSR